MKTLSPAEMGMLAATLDDAISAGLGDDDTVQALAGTVLAERMANTEETAYSVAYDFFRGERK